MHGLYIGGLVLEPANVICYQVDILASSASYKDYSLVVGVLGEGANGLGIAFAASEAKHIQLSVLSLYARNAVHYRDSVLGLYNVHFLLTHLGCRYLHVLLKSWRSSRGQVFSGTEQIGGTVGDGGAIVVCMDEAWD